MDAQLAASRPGQFPPFIILEHQRGHPILLVKPHGRGLPADVVDQPHRRQAAGLAARQRERARGKNHRPARPRPEDLGDAEDRRAQLGVAGDDRGGVGQHRLGGKGFVGLEGVASLTVLGDDLAADRPAAGAALLVLEVQAAVGVGL